MTIQKNNNKREVVVAVVVSVILVVGMLMFKYENYPEVEILPSAKPVSSDNSFTSIEEDLENTIILEEDFSDL